VLDRFCGGSTGSMVAVGEAQGARSFLWELDGLYGCCGGGSRSSIVSVGARRALWLLWGMLKELSRFCESSTRSMVALREDQEARRALWLLWGRLKELNRFCGSSTGSMVAVGDARGARSFLWELDGVYGCCGGCSRSSIVSVGA
jgi:hypothetical protein